MVSKIIKIFNVRKNTIGIIVGDGTGPELEQVFNLVVHYVSQKYKVNIDLVKCPCIPRTYHSINKKNVNYIENITNKDIECIWNFLVNFYNDGGRVIFRTAINAEALYQIRLLGKAVKVMPEINLKYGNKILLIRDLTEGYYANREYKITNNKITFIGGFTKRHIKELCEFSLEKAKDYLGKRFEIWCIYKYHLFANVLERWFKKYIPEIHIYQPDTGIHNLLKYIKSKNNKNNLVLLTGNEVGDLLIEFLILYLNIGTKEQLYNKDVFLSKNLKNLEIYQTIHGSADNIKGRGVVNPIATLRAAAAIVEEKLGVKGFKFKVEKAIKKAIRKRIVTPDMGGKSKTLEVTKFIIEEALK